jgi:hypothetical protein
MTPLVGIKPNGRRRQHRQECEMIGRALAGVGAGGVGLRRQNIVN